ncbi:MAG: hypothetical protein EAX96_19420 [Candidatus Lokiarchaeota archaeon]|nr:hypothetical protein [Candidatus Lokiarchaeota archaeon]
MNKLELMDYFFHPKNLTLVGVSRKLIGVSSMLLMSLIRKKFKGDIHLINKNIKDGHKIMGQPIKSDLNQIESDLDLVYIIVPSKAVPSVLEECSAKNMKAAVIISSGFSESIGYNKDKLQLQDEIVSIARKNGFVFAGPNCNGIYSEDVSLYAIFGPRFITIPNGHISVVSRGGTAGCNTINEIAKRGVGVSKFINLGDAACLDLQDFIEYYNQDPVTKVIGVYTEGISDGKRFLKIARKCGYEKPVVMYKAGQTRAGQQAATSHVGAIAGKFSNRIYEGFAKQTGIITVESIIELADVCSSFMLTYLPKGKRVGVITPAGSLGVQASDAINNAGLELATLNPATIEKLNGFLPEYWSHSNPIDLTDSMDFSVIGKLAKILADEDNFDGMLVIFGDMPDDQESMAEMAGNIAEDMGLGDQLESFRKMMENEDMLITMLKSEIKKISRSMFKQKKPVFFLGSSQAKSGMPDMLREHKIVPLPETHRIARTYAALARWGEMTQMKQILS